jgi:hypothetical protein
MAFQDGSPMHPSYGAGHATVAGTCFTILKAFFNTDAVFVRWRGPDRFALHAPGDTPVHGVPDGAGANLLDSLSVPTFDGEVVRIGAR